MPSSTWRSPLTDEAAYWLHPKHHWVYNKLLVAESQGLYCGPHGIEPERFPVFSKPLMNLDGMGTGIALKVVPFIHEPGHMWMEVLEGEHISVDMMLRAGYADISVATLAHPGAHLGTYDSWEVRVKRPDAIRTAQAWAKKHLADYRGPLNVEIMGNKVFEAHLRLSWQYLDLYEDGGHSVCLFVEGAHKEIEAPDLAQIEALYKVKVTLDRDEARPPGATRLAVVNGQNRRACDLARASLLRYTNAPPIMKKERGQ